MLNGVATNDNSSRAKVIIFGLGDYYRRVRDLMFETFDVIALVDSSNYGTIIDGFKIIRPQQILSYDFDYVVIASSFELEIKDTLITLGIEIERLKTVGEFPSVLRKIEHNILIPDKARQQLAKTNKTRILFVMNSMLAGGAEKALIALLRNMDVEKYQVSLFLFEYSGFYLSQIPNDITVFDCFLTDADSLYKRIWLRHTKAYEAHQKLIHIRANIEIAFIEGWATKIVSGGLQQGKVAWVHTNLVTNHWTKECFLSRTEECEAYCKMDQVVFVSQDSKTSFEKSYKVNSELVVLPNIIDPPHFKTEIQPINLDASRFVYVGRLSEIKGVDRLIDAFSQLAAEYGYLRLLVIGDGEQMSSLKAQVNQLKLHTVVDFAGFVEQPFQLITPNDIFINSSKTEGHPLAIAEALLIGLAVIATKCTGNSEILKHGEFGELADNSVNGLYETMKSLIVDPEKFHLAKYKATLGQSQFNTGEMLEKFDSMLQSLRNKIEWK